MKDLKNTVSESNRFGIPADELAELTEIFNLVDIDHGGSIDGDEVRQLMQTLGIQTTEVRNHDYGIELSENYLVCVFFIRFTSTRCIWTIHYFWALNATSGRDRDDDQGHLQQ